MPYLTSDRLRSETWIASRFGWSLVHGPIIGDLNVCHTCDNPPCQNPAHWFLGTDKDNAVDKVRKGRLVANPYRDGSNRFASPESHDYIVSSSTGRQRNVV